ncbi:PCYCGC motif-containing (lipo)protein [Cytobacillus sp. FJAT-53684]|uniref:PCYCGC motif-containing (Lipo)protein n=1 Tax=Cytobacillus mangrovibacter TaxID=3299024 RepID=A0ABW6JVB1_9BACI
MKKTISMYFLSIATILLLLSACSSAEKETANPGNEENEHSFHAENGDLRELTASLETAPTFLNDKHEQIQMVYAAVGDYQDLLEYIPCYCGCKDSAAHKDNYDCFIYENKENGEVVWDDHGTRCGTCLDTAAESINLYNEGKSMKEIRQYIDEKYKEGYADPTSTPFPA